MSTELPEMTAQLHIRLSADLLEQLDKRAV